MQEKRGTGSVRLHAAEQAVELIASLPGETIC